MKKGDIARIVKLLSNDCSDKGAKRKKKRKLLIAAAKLLNHGSHLLTTWEAEAR